MKHKISLLVLLSCISLSLVSCNKKLDDPKDYQDKIVEYKQEVSNEKFNSYNDKLKQHKLKNSQRDYVMDQYFYTSQNTVTKLDDVVSSTSESLETRQYTINMDYENKLRQEHRITDKIVSSDSLGVHREDNNHYDEEFGHQEINGKIRLIEKNDKVIRNIPQSVNDFISNTYPQDDLLVSMLSITGKCYIDNDNTYTLIETEDNNLIQSEKLQQLVIKDDEITYLKLEKYTKQNKFIYNEVDSVVDAYYQVIKFKDVTLKPIDVTGFKIKGLVD